MTMPSESKTPKQTLVEEGTEFKGVLKSSCPVVVNGTIDGEVDAPEITITRSGAVLGAIKAKKVKSQGTLSGNVDAGDVFLAGSVRSNTVIKARSLEVKLGSSDKGQLEVTFGECNLEVGEAPKDDDSNGWSTSSDSDSSKESRPSSPTATSTSSDSDSLGSPSPTLSSRSPWKSSRLIEASGGASIDDGSKNTLR
jgi:cytoskeletal protein CcmA (bactofilin family)